MDLVQVWKAVFVKVSFASLGFEPRTFSYPGSCATNTLLAKKILNIKTLHCSEKGPYCRDRDPIEAFFTFWIPV